MAVLSEQDRADTAAEGMRDNRLGTLTNMLKVDWRAAVDAAVRGLIATPQAITALYQLQRETI